MSWFLYVDFNRLEQMDESQGLPLEMKFFGFHVNLQGENEGAPSEALGGVFRVQSTQILSSLVSPRRWSGK